MAKSWRISRPYFGEDHSFSDFVDRARSSEVSAAQEAVFLALQKQSHIYGGTVPPEEVARRRARNRAARRARAGNTAAIARQARLDRRRRGRRFSRGQAPTLNLGGVQ